MRRLVLAAWAPVLAVVPVESELWEQELSWVLKPLKEELGQQQGQRGELVQQQVEEQVLYFVLEREGIERKPLIQISNSERLNWKLSVEQPEEVGF